MNLDTFIGCVCLAGAFVGFLVYEVNWRYVAHLFVKIVEGGK